ncbi:MAG: hypothetical protein R3B95_11670 [Nitrospirales bacterium]|nr:hypothetical protein [Nitrospirales bacterium]
MAVGDNGISGRIIAVDDNGSIWSKKWNSNYEYLWQKIPDPWEEQRGELQSIKNRDRWDDEYPEETEAT